MKSPKFVTVNYRATITPAFILDRTPDDEDPFGYLYSLASPVCIGSADASINPNDAAPRLCSRSKVCGISAQQTALYLTTTSSSVEDVPAAANKQGATPKPTTPEPAPAPNTPLPAPNTPAPAPAQNTPAAVPKIPAPAPAQNTPVAQQKTSPDAAAGIGAVLNPGTQLTPLQADPTQPTQPATTPDVKSPGSPSPSPAAVIVVGSSSIIAHSNSVFVISGQSLSAGGAVVVEGTSISLGSAGQVAVIGGVTQQVQTVHAAQTTPILPAPVISIAGSAITAQSNSAFIVDGQTIAPGSAIVVAGATVSVLLSGAGVVVNGATQTFQVSVPSTASPVLTVNGQTYSENTQSAYVIAGQTLSAGKTLVVSGTTIALASTGGVVVINGVTQTLAPSSKPAALTINGQTITANPQSSYIISGQTLAPGHPITIGSGTSATTLSLATDGAGHPVVVVNGKTSTLGSSGSVGSTASKTSSTTTIGVGDFVASGIGFSSAGAPQATATTAGSATLFSGMSALIPCSLLGSLGVLMWL